MKKIIGTILCIMCSVCAYAQSYTFKFNYIYPYKDKVDVNFFIEDEAHVVLDIKNRTIIYNLFSQGSEYRVFDSCSIIGQEEGDGTYTTFTVRNSHGETYLVRYVYQGDAANTFFIIFDKPGVYNYLLPAATDVTEIAYDAPTASVSEELLVRVPKSKYVLGTISPGKSVTLKGDFNKDGQANESIRFKCDSDGYCQFTTFQNGKGVGLLSFPESSEVNKILMDEAAGYTSDLMGSSIELAKADLDRDGKVDFLFALRYGGLEYVAVFKNMGNCRFKWAGEVQPPGDIPFVEDNALYVPYINIPLEDAYIIKNGKLVQQMP